MFSDRVLKISRNFFKLIEFMCDNEGVESAKNDSQHVYISFSKCMMMTGQNYKVKAWLWCVFPFATVRASEYILIFIR